MERSAGLRDPFRLTPWVTIWRSEGALAVLDALQLAMQSTVPATPENSGASSASRAAPPLPAPHTPPCGDPTQGDPPPTTDASGRDNATTVWDDERLPGQGDEDSEAAATDVDAESVVSWSSNKSEGSNTADVTIQVEANKTWCTTEDKLLGDIAALATFLREHPLLPPPQPQLGQSGTQATSGLPFPAIHCAFQGCTWTSDVEACNPHWTKDKLWTINHGQWQHSHLECCEKESCLWQHLKSHNGQHFEHMETQDIPARYTAALFHKEEQHVPQIGWSIDRRTMRRLRCSLPEDQLQALICACCPKIHVGGDHGEVGYISVGDLFSNLIAESIEWNWDHAKFEHRYGQHPSIQQRFSATEWVRRLPATVASGQTALCCPEDAFCNTCSPQTDTFCEQCQLPLCRSCLERMHLKNNPAVPEALTNDNWYGYPTELLYTKCAGLRRPQPRQCGHPLWRTTWKQTEGTC